MDKKENIKKILEKIQEAEYVLVGPISSFTRCEISLAMVSASFL